MQNHSISRDSGAGDSASKVSISSHSNPSKYWWGDFFGDFSRFVFQLLNDGQKPWAKTDHRLNESLLNGGRQWINGETFA
jgi:hypothetical protein